MLQSEKNAQELQELWNSLSPEATDLVSRVIRIEKEKLHMSLPRGIYDDLYEAVTEVVK